MKKVILVFFTLFMFLGCKKETSAIHNAEHIDTDSGTVCIAVLPTLECMPLMVAQENGLFDSCGVKVALKTYSSQADCDTAMAGRHADGMVSDIIRAAYWERENHRKLNYATWTNTHFMLISSKKSRIKQLSQMTDRLMAVTRYSVTDVLADSAMIRAGKSPEEMFKVQINDQEIRLNMLLENKMDAAFLQHPFAAQAVAAGGSVLMHGGKSHAGIIVFGEYVDTTKVNKILSAYDNACDMINNKGIMNFAYVASKYMHRDITKWNRQIGDVKFRHSQDVGKDEQKKAGAWVKDN